MSDPVVQVPISSTNAVVSQTFTNVVAAFQALGMGFLGYLANDPSALISITKGWPAWAAIAGVAGLQWVKTKYLTNSNSTTVQLVNSIVNQAQVSLEAKALGLPDPAVKPASAAVPVPPNTPISLPVEAKS